MSIIGTLKYRRYAAKSPQDPDGAAKWYARAVQDRTVEFEEVSRKDWFFVGSWRYNPYFYRRKKEK